ncbi:Sjogren's syndrome/scleroderma autoantigen 1 family protein [Halegenticoccus tardaugens]|uniref:Sjogren's syndrome/scleroderma autoantigen 1 family protein n=1 Tax=Halegenticoccus tardaugens TaxID=2071624 RepID=UPI00100B886B|nr:Sjogren's syndrome/scleroderma autoantigen 1 family protein [Halegenticoccus tardaugens]
MSDFDKEAEREKLRKKFEKDREKRKSTQVMSELLLQGATMTNKHCDACGNPLFRQGGEEFCPICREAGAEAARVDDGEEATGATGATEAVPGASEAGDAEAGEDRPADEPSGGPAAAAGESVDGQNPEAPGGASRNVDEPAGRSSPADGAASRRVVATGESAGAGPSEARAALVDALTRCAREAEAADDPRSATEWLAASREAAEALAALRQ